ncbi:non-hydrolyzing UDP-N-acetylglucosamine 2-epimerase [Caedibacter taeniospiralis]|jgi:UDP-N-acetylglucosamine 2-epimerase|uniref:non-hydrolyzing UDP-N-acetylglucosamine 2-epimerase n=1 Tax=Caedibacter taeniospiralis TaxID=28907 RepID=UPI0037BF5973
MQKLKLMTIVGTRPEIIRLSEMIKEADRCFEQILVHTGQNYDYELNQIFFADLELRAPDIYLNAVGKSLGETVGNIIASSYVAMQEHQPDALLLLGDTNSCLAAYAAKRLKIPIFHMEAGNRCFDQNVPEEINRRIVDCISDVNLAYTEHSRRYLLSEGAKKEYTFVIGSPMTEVLRKNLHKIEQSKILHELALQRGNYIVVSAHREENIDSEKNFNSLMEALNTLAEKYNMPVIYSLHPRSKAFLEKRNIRLHPHLKLMKPFGFIDYNALQKNAYVVVSDSGTLSEESAILSFPGVLIRTSTERPEAVDKGTVVIACIDKQSVLQAIEVLKNTFDYEHSRYELPYDYQDHNVSQKVIRIIQGYTPIINQFIWRK